jgi:hypothetical protein
MKIVPFPKPRRSDDEALTAEIEAALHGRPTAAAGARPHGDPGARAGAGLSGGEAADYWRELRADVRSLAPPISPEFEQRLRERIERREVGTHVGWAQQARKRLSVGPAFARAQAWLVSGLRARVVALAGICVLAGVVTLVLVAPWRGSNGQIGAAMFRPDQMRPAGVTPRIARAGSSVASAGADAGEAAESASAPVREQQRAAAITLAPKPGNVQSVADAAARLATQLGGFVQSSQVHLEHGSDGEANVELSVPSARLSAALASLAQLAPTRAESQSLQDVTDAYDTARTKLADAVAERQALLRALARASTQGEIDSLHARLSLAAGAIARAHGEYEAVAKRASSSAIEVTVRGDARAGGERSTLGNGLHDAGDVLETALAVLIVALAVLLPFAILSALFVLGRRATRRRLRERALS